MAPDETPLRFDGRVAVVTGAGRGLGRAYALLLAERGAAVVVNDLGVDTHGNATAEDRAAAVAAEIRDAGGTAVANRDTVATADGGEAIIASALADFGRVDIVVNNAGPQGGDGFAEFAEERIDALLTAHLRGAFHVTRPAWRAMRTQRYGRIVMTSSQAVFGIPCTAPYAAAKGGLIGLTNTLALEGARHGIKTNAVLPVARTAGNDGIRNAAFRTWLQHFRPEHVAPVVALLAHEDCPWNGEKLIAGGGRVSRLFLATTRGAFLPDPTPEDVARAADAVADESAYTVPAGAMDDMAAWTPHFTWPDQDTKMNLY
ncbi:SDR family NAD(P)-dependent oxidoreductase [Yinghuangia sp. YIM S09857]|uniref:SDR family NAD(P)-dependent oxidoreductase n=1 Tax=Yinghuangia sp. YIM S09857 TaxID=3436929 RepID=UPI003F53395E